ncbi:MAG: type II toxin-antitoxin system PemK/MazF family toxin [Candidatus Omnitrophica bacterium]|nr:type II toxin-antitoxin system PemK/MazF family toxin [Candidatus Omnitrophota bacterium]MCM8776904.1 type II toxin-antitoxin system PemK/MazF family toxin [Candidatus Omnitrophota bacterium]
MDFPQRGEIWLVSLEPVIGHEIGKIRPAVVISNDLNNEFADTVTVLPITSQIKKVYPFEVLFSAKETGLSKNSKVKCNQIRTVDKKRLVKFVSKVSEEKIFEIEQALLIHLGISSTDLL